MTADKRKILLVEDDINLGTILKDFLIVKNYEVFHALNGIEGSNSYRDNQFDLIILDIMMPKKDGFALAEEIRKLDKNIPIIFLSARSMVEDKIKGLKLGGDDYVTKPFSVEELLLRVENIFKRMSSSNEVKTPIGTMEVGKYLFNYNKRILTLNGSKRKLTTRECELLRLLALNKNDLLQRSVALKEIWNDNNYFTARSMDVYITKLRSYLNEDKDVEIINVHGSGYKLIVH